MKNQFTLSNIIAAASATFLTGAAMAYLLLTAEPKAEDNSQTKPLYWVAPMDPAYRRDRPGKSPMGMDLVPVYKKNDHSQDPAGTVTISSSVENNLGVKTTQVQRETLTPVIKTAGMIEYNKDSLIQINSRTEGWVKNLQVFSVGEQVRKDDRLFDFYSPTLITAQEELLTVLRSGEKKLIQAAKSNLKALGLPGQVIDKLIKKRTVSSLITFRAPADGVVSTLNTSNGGYINPAKTIMELTSIDTVWVVAEIFERQASQITVGQSALMATHFMPGVTRKGTVDYIYPTLNPETRGLRVRLTFDNPTGRLRPNMYADISIQTGQHKVLAVPSHAIIRTGSGDRVVKVTGEGKYLPVNILAGREFDKTTEIITGLSVGDQIVTSAQFLLDSESSVNRGLERISSQEKHPAEMNHSAMHHTGSDHSKMDHSAHQKDASMADKINAESSQSPAVREAL